MTMIALPDCFDDPSSFSLSLLTTQRVSSSNFGGSEQVGDMLSDRWTLTVAVPNRTHEEAAALEAFVASLRGMTNTVLMFHGTRHVPLGTMRGAPVVSSAVQFSDSIEIFAEAGSTLKAGDMLGIGGLLLQVARDCVADGFTGSADLLCTVPIVNRLRRSVTTGSAVTWEKPTAPFRLASKSAVQYVPGYSPEVSFDFIEAVG